METIEEEELKKCLKIQGYKSCSESDSDCELTKADLDKAYKNWAPPPRKINPARHTIITLNDFKNEADSVKEFAGQENNVVPNVQENNASKKRKKRKKKQTVLTTMSEIKSDHYDQVHYNSDLNTIGPEKLLVGNEKTDCDLNDGFVEITSKRKKKNQNNETPILSSTITHSNRNEANLKPSNLNEIGVFVEKSIIDKQELNSENSQQNVLKENNSLLSEESHEVTMEKPPVNEVSKKNSDATKVELIALNETDDSMAVSEKCEKDGEGSTGKKKKKKKKKSKNVTAPLKSPELDVVYNCDKNDGSNQFVAAPPHVTAACVEDRRTVMEKICMIDRNFIYYLKNADLEALKRYRDMKLNSVSSHTEENAESNNPQQSESFLQCNCGPMKFNDGAIIQKTKGTKNANESDAMPLTDTAINSSPFESAPNKRQTQLSQDIIDDLTFDRHHFYGGYCDKSNFSSWTSFQNVYLNEKLSVIPNKEEKPKKQSTTFLWEDLKDYCFSDIEATPTFIFACIFLRYFIPWFLTSAIFVIDESLDTVVLIFLFIYLCIQFIVKC